MSFRIDKWPCCVNLAGGHGGRISHKQIIIIGAGVGGLSAAIRLAANGQKVTVVERGDVAGGKIRTCDRPDMTIDVGPTVATMLWVFESLFQDAGSKLSDHVQLEQVATLAHHRWNDGSRLNLYADRHETLDAIGHFSGKRSVAEYRHFAEQARNAYSLLESNFLTRPQAGLSGLLRQTRPDQWTSLAALSPFRSLWSELGRRFSDARLRQLFARYATYCGSSPLLAPATLMLIAHAESTGVWRIRGGMVALAEALTTYATANGVTFRYNTEARRLLVDDGEVYGIELDSGEQLRSSLVVFNGDSNALAAGHLGKASRAAVAPTSLRQRSLSAVTFAGLGHLVDPDLSLHNVFFSDDYCREFEQLVRARELATDPTVYLHAPDHGTRGEQGIFLLVNAPPNGDRFSYDTHVVEAVRRALAKQLRRCGIELCLDEFEVTTPNDFHERYATTGGALYGPAMHGWQAAFRRPGQRSKIRGLYLAGGSIHPGSGVPMAALSGCLAADCLLDDFDLRQAPQIHSSRKSHAR